MIAAKKVSPVVNTFHPAAIDEFKNGKLLEL